MGMEFRMTTDLATAMPAEITFNYDELKAELEKRLAYYNDLVVTEDTIQESKADLARLRKLKEALDDRRKDIEKEWNKPLATFKGQIKDLGALIDKPVAVIDGQIKGFAEQEKEKKRGEIEKAYAELIPEDYHEIIPFARILDPKWLNKTTTMKSIRKALEDRAKRVRVDMALIDGVNPQYMAAVRTKYIQTLDVNTALDYQDELRAAEERFQAQEAARQQRLAQMAARQAQVPQVNEQPPAAAQEPPRDPAPQASSAAKQYVLRLEFHLTMDQANALKAFLTDNDINYTKI